MDRGRCVAAHDLLGDRQGLVDGDRKPGAGRRCSNPLPTDAAVSIPTTWPAAFKSGPPESPGCTAAFVSIIPDRLSLPPWSSLTVIPRPTPVTVPEAGRNEPVPPAFPSAVTDWPALTASESAQGNGLQIRGAAGLQDGDVIGCVIADDLGGEAAARLRHDDLDRRRTADDVVVRQHLARRRQHHAGARRPRTLVGEVGVDDDDAGADRRRACRGEGEAGGNRRYATATSAARTMRVRMRRSGCVPRGAGRLVSSPPLVVAPL